MRTKLILLLLSVLSTISPISADNIDTMGHWDEEELSRRNFVPARPVASINGSIISIYSSDALPNLNILITDAEGIIIYQGYHSFAEGEIIDLPILTEKGEYMIRMCHFHKYLVGHFNIY